MTAARQPSTGQPATRTPASGAGARVVRLPQRAPIASVQGALALDLSPRLDPPEGFSPRPVHDDDTGRAGQRALERMIRNYLGAAVEIACGNRPLAQLMRHTRADVYRDLGRRARLVSMAAGTSPATGRGRGAIRPVLESVHTCAVSEVAIEACARIRYGNRSRALAARFEARAGRWQCVALEFS